MHVCLLTTSFPRYSEDYAGNFVLELARQITRSGVRVRVVAPHAPGTARRETIDGVEVYRFSYFWPWRWQRVAYLDGIPNNLRRDPLAWLQLPFFLVAFLLQAWRSGRDSDVWHTYWTYTGIAILPLTVFSRIPMVLTVQGSDVNLFAHKSRLLRWLGSQVVRRASKVIAVSSPLATLVEELFDAAPEQVVVIPNGVHPHIFDTDGQNRSFAHRLVWVGRMSLEKGLKYLLDAMPEIVAEHPDTKLTLVGDGPLRDELVARVEALDIEAQVQFAGEVAHEKIVVYLQEADLFVLPSLNEGLPLSLLEAMSVGLPVVACRTGGIPDVVITDGPEKNGILVPAKNPAALAHAINHLFANPDKAREMGQMGQALVRQQCAWKRVAEKTVELYFDIF